MSTGNEYFIPTNKRLASFEDLNERGFGYLRALLVETNKFQFRQGSFTEKVNIDSPGANLVRITAKTVLGDGYVHDGAGHIIDCIYESNASLFQNTAAVSYEVGVGFVAKPSGVQINPRTGLPEFRSWIETIGDEADPTLVTDNGSTITFSINSVDELSGMSLAGRTARVFMKVPAASATSDAVAIEVCTVAFGGGVNTITTTGLLGQASVSTDPEDYTVQLIGLSVRPATAPAPISVSDHHFFAGTVLGNGATPTVFSITNQVVVQSDQPQAFLPYTGAAPQSWNLASTNVQNVIEEIVDDLSANGGADLLGVEDASFETITPATNTSWGGLGTVNSVQDALDAADNQISKARVGITHSVSMLSDSASIDSIASTLDDETHLIKGTTALTFGVGVTTIPNTAVPVVIGESPNKSKILVEPTVSGFNFCGLYERLAIGASQPTTIGEHGVAHLRNCLLAPNTFSLNAGAGSTPDGAYTRRQAQSMYGVHMSTAMAGTTPSQDEGFIFTKSGSDQGAQHIANCIFDQGYSAATGPLVEIQNVAAFATENRCMRVFENCLFYSTVTNQDAVAINAGDAVFIGCSFVVDHADVASIGKCVTGSGLRDVTFIGCDFWTSTGNLLDISGSTPYRGVNFIGCGFYGSTAAPRTTGTERKFINAQAVTFDKCVFVVPVVSCRYIASTPTVSPVHMISCAVKDSAFRWGADFTEPHGTTAWLLDDCDVEATSFEFPSAAIGTGGLVYSVGTFANVFYAEDSTLRGCKFHGTMSLDTVNQSSNDWTPIDLVRTNSSDCKYDVATGGSATAGLIGIINLSESSAVRWTLNAADGNSLDGYASLVADCGYFNMNTGSTVEGCFFDGANVNGFFQLIQTSGSKVIFQINGDHCKVLNNKARHSDGSAAIEMNFCVVVGAAATISGNLWYMDSGAAATRFFISAGTGLPSNTIVTENRFYKNGSGTSPANTTWINLTSGGGGTRSMVQRNTLWNAAATAPAIQVGANSLTADGTTNILVNSVAVSIDPIM